MKIVIAPDSFKESLTSNDAAKAIQKGFQSGFPDADYYLCPIADGGEGTLDILSTRGHKIIEKVMVTGALFAPTEARILFSSDYKKSFIEMAEVCGLQKVAPKNRNVLQSTSYGVGELILYSLNKGATEITIGVGGTATNDGGIGMATALGYQFFNEKGTVLRGCTNDLFSITSFSIASKNKLLDHCEISIAADVSNPLFGPKGATRKYGYQKGLSMEKILNLDKAMEKFYEMAEHLLDKKVSDILGSGAGGGMGAGLLLFTNARMEKGIEFVTHQLNLEKLCQNADIVICGEGKMDGQTIYGKAPIGVAKCAPESSIVIAICGSVGSESEKLYSMGIDAIFPSLQELQPENEMFACASENVERTSRNIAMLLQKERELL